MYEKQLEHKLVALIQSLDGMCLKLVSPGCAGVPDRLCLLPGGRALFVEVKKPGQRVRPLQHYRLKQLTTLGFTALVVDSESCLEEVKARCAISHTTTKH